MSIVLDGLTKHYGAHTVVNKVSLEISDGELFVLLGSSGSGKTTVLHMIAGLTEVDAGRILLHGRDVTDLAPQQRRVGLVFQHYALFQNMSVADNVEFGLRVHKVPVAERARRRDELLDLVGLAGLGARRPAKLSGGQQQRVALARALANKPDVLLLDEPLGALDAKIRADLRRSLKAIQRELGVTTILVTHDQVEAFELADRLGVMSFGRLIEVGPPRDLYLHPSMEFTAAFLGTANLLLGEREAGSVRVGATDLPVSSGGEQIQAGERTQVLFRPEDMVLAAMAEAVTGTLLGEGEVEHCTFSGAQERIRLRLRLSSSAGVRPIEPPRSFGREDLSLEATRPIQDALALPLRTGDRVWVGVRRSHALAHPGLAMAVLVDGSSTADDAVKLSGEIARLAHARLALLATAGATSLSSAKERVGGGMASLETQAVPLPPGEALRQWSEAQPCDLVLVGTRGEKSLGLVAQVLGGGSYHVLVVPGPAGPPKRALISVATGEPGKNDVLFAARLLRHMDAEATVLYVDAGSAAAAGRADRERAERFLAASVRSLEALGVAATARTRSGPVAAEIEAELGDGAYDLLVIGAPLTEAGQPLGGETVVGQLIRRARVPVLIVQFSPS